MPSLSYGDDSIVRYNTSGILSDSDLFYDKDPINGFGMSMDTYYKHIYNMYPTINSCIFRMMEYAFGLTYELYHKWKKHKDKMGDEYSNKMNILNGNSFHLTRQSETFGNFISMLLSFSPKEDPNLIFNAVDYVSKVMALKKDLEKTNGVAFNENGISISVGCTHNEYPMIKDKGKSFFNTYNTGLSFVVYPYLKTIENTVSESLVEITQEVYIDINRLICFFAESFDPGRLPEYLEKCENDKEEYIKNGLDKFKDLPEKFTRKIILELFDNHENIQSNWSHFLRSLDISYTKLLSDDRNLEIICRKLKHFNVSLPENISNILFKNDPSINSSNPTRKNMYYYNNFIETLQSAYLGLSDETPLENIGKGLICKAFCNSFASSVLYKVCTYGEQGVIFKEYVKDFYRGYSKGELKEEASKINDYNIRDFMRTLIQGEIKYEKSEKIYSSKLTNGEYSYFMYCKIIRSTWINTMLKLYTLLVLNSNSKILDESRGKLNKERILRSLNSTITDDIYNTLDLLSSLYRGELTSYFNLIWKFDYLRKMYINMTLRENNGYKFDNNFKLLGENLDSFQYGPISVFNNTILSEFTRDKDNISDLTVDAIFDNIKQTFIANGIIVTSIDED